MIYNSLIEEGYDKGIDSRNIEIARNLLDNNVSIDIIMKSTGLSKKQVEELSNK
ncbi:MAG: hypothetical protein ACI31R_05855 [Bacilli bacterium]